MKKRLLVALSVGVLLTGVLTGCTPEEELPEPRESAPVAAPEDEGPVEVEDAVSDPQEEWEGNFFVLESGVTCGFLYRDDGSVGEYICYLPEPSFETTDGIGQPLDCEDEAYVLSAVLDSEIDLYCAVNPTPAGLLVAPGETKEQASVMCSGVGDELQCSFPYWDAGMGIEVSNDGFTAYMQDDATHSPGTAEGKQYFLPIPFERVD